MLCSAQGKGPLSGLPGHCTKQGCPRLGVEDIQSQQKQPPTVPASSLERFTRFRVLRIDLLNSCFPQTPRASFSAMGQCCVR